MIEKPLAAACLLAELPDSCRTGCLSWHFLAYSWRWRSHREHQSGAGRPVKGYVLQPNVRKGSLHLCDISDKKTLQAGDTWRQAQSR